jgi:hypothetical protein
MNAIAPIQADPKAKPPKEFKITGKVKVAIDAMVWQGLKRDEAAQLAGIKDNSLYVALRRPDVKAYYLAECEMLRTSGKARRIHRLEAMLEQDDNKAAVINAALALENMGKDQASVNAGQSRTAGVVVIIQGSAALSGNERGFNQPLDQNDAKPLITLDAGPARGPDDD